MKVKLNRVSREETLKHKNCMSFSMAVNGKWVNNFNVRSDCMSETEIADLANKINHNIPIKDSDVFFKTLSFQLASDFIGTAIWQKGMLINILKDAHNFVEDKEIKDLIKYSICNMGDAFDNVFDPDKNTISEEFRDKYPKDITTYDQLFCVYFTNMFLENGIITFYDAEIEK